MGRGPGCFLIASAMKPGEVNAYVFEGCYVVLHFVSRGKGIGLGNLSHPLLIVGETTFRLMESHTGCCIIHEYTLLIVLAFLHDLHVYALHQL